jgi:hypothetical protein
MITLGIECRRESENVSGTKLDAETASLAALNVDLNDTFGCHGVLKRASRAPVRCG